MGDWHDDDISRVDMMHFLKRIVRDRGVSAHHIDSMNSFVTEGIPTIIERGFSLKQTIINRRTDTADGDNAITHIEWSLTFKGVNITKPATNAASLGTQVVKVGERATATTVESANALGIMMPAFAREYMLSYLMTLQVDVIIVATAYMKNGSSVQRQQTVDGLAIGQVPCMVHSVACHLHGMDRSDLIALHEDPNDEGGYFILRGNEQSIDCIENTTINDIRLTMGRTGTEMARAQIWSKNGDGFNNSYQCIVRRMINGAITIETQIFSLEKFQVPFMVLFRLLTEVSDATITSYIIGDTRRGDPLTQAMVALLNEAFVAPYEDQWTSFIAETNRTILSTNMAKRVLEITKSALADNDENVARQAYGALQQQINERILSHLGVLDVDRAKKVRYLGIVMRKLFLMILGVIAPLDRDSLAIKRIQPAGISASKAFKTMFSSAITSPIRKAITTVFEKLPFAEANMASAIHSAIKVDALSSKMIKAFTVGNTDVQIGMRTTRNRVSSQGHYVRNDLNARAIANNVTPANSPSNKQTDRADLMRRVQSSHVGYLDVTQSVDTGDKVGMNKQIAVSATISLAIPSEPLKAAILSAEHGVIIPWAEASMSRIVEEKLSYVFVNGDWIGCIARDWEFVARWRLYRRRAGPQDPMIHRNTSICWDAVTRETRFWTDAGRMMRPLVIVYNNLDEYNTKCLRAGEAPDSGEFAQWTRLSRELISDYICGRRSMKDMQKDGIIEYISADECDNIFIAPSIDALRSSRHDLSRRYTHCEIEQAIHGIVTLSSPLMNHAYGIRTTYFCNQRKQSCAWYSCAFPYRTDKKTMFQYYCERPLVSTFTDELVNPNGHNCMVALMIHTGYNQEDSVFINAGSVQRGMFNGSFFDYETSIREPGEMFARLDASQVDDRRAGVIDDFVSDGVARLGTLLMRNYTMIQKVALASGTGETSARRGDAPRHIDRSTIYMKRTPAYVFGIVRGTNDSRAQFIRVKYRQIKNMIRGDKVSSRSGNKGIVSRLVPDCNMPYSEYGVRPDIVVNTQSIPTRRALNQIIESLLGVYAANIGCHIDATASMPIDVDTIMEALVALGFQDAGYTRMYNGCTGEWLDTPIYIGPTCYQRLGKFVDNECRAVRRGPVDVVTHQPVRGGIEHGALRIGEMEFWSLIGQGSQRSFGEKTKTDSDGTVVYVCARCGHAAIYNEIERLYDCHQCGQYAQIVATPTTWASNLLLDELQAQGVQSHLEIEPLSFFVRESHP